MKVSFLVTYYNQQQYVKQSLDSILTVQKDFEWEILVGDDGSTDRTADEVQQYINKYPDNIKLFVMTREPDKEYFSIKRASENRMNLLEKCSGDYFCVLDGDDFYCDSDFINEAIRKFDENRELSVVAFNYQLFYPDGKTHIATPIRKISSNVDTGYYLKYFYTHAGACVFRRDVFLRKNYQDIKKVGYFDDNDIVLIALKYGQMFYINKTVYSYRQTGNSVWTTRSLCEQNFLNSLGYDEEVLIAPEYKKYLIRRYYDAMYYVWKNRYKISRDMVDKYLGLSKSIKNSLVYKIINYNDLHFSEKLGLQFFFIKSECKFFPYRLYLGLKVRIKRLVMVWVEHGRKN